MRFPPSLPAGSPVVCRWNWLRRVWAIEHGSVTIYRSEVALRNARRLVVGRSTVLIRGIICPRRELQTVKAWSAVVPDPGHALLRGTDEPEILFEVA